MSNSLFHVLSLRGLCVKSSIQNNTSAHKMINDYLGSHLMDYFWIVIITMSVKKCTSCPDSLSQLISHGKSYMR